MDSTASNIPASPNSPRDLLAHHNLNTAEQKRHDREIEMIAQQLERPLAEIARMYADVYADLKSRAHVTDYLPLLVAKKVRARLQILPSRANDLPTIPGHTG